MVIEPSIAFLPGLCSLIPQLFAEELTNEGMGIEMSRIMRIFSRKESGSPEPGLSCSPLGRVKSAIVSRSPLYWCTAQSTCSLRAKFLHISQLGLGERRPPPEGKDAALGAQESGVFGNRLVIRDLQLQRRIGLRCREREWTAQPEAESSSVAA